MDILVGEEVGSTKKYANKDVDIRSVYTLQENKLEKILYNVLLSVVIFTWYIVFTKCVSYKYLN
jgi:hypothetical protein